DGCVNHVHASVSSLQDPLDHFLISLLVRFAQISAYKTRRRQDKGTQRVKRNHKQCNAMQCVHTYTRIPMPTLDSFMPITSLQCPSATFVHPRSENATVPWFVCVQRQPNTQSAPHR